jgi:hypothetical protein
MEQKQMIKQMIEFNQTTFNNAYDAMVLIQDQFEKVTKTALDQADMLPPEGRKAIESWSEVFKDGRKSMKEQIDSGFQQVEKLFVI